MGKRTDTTGSEKHARSDGISRRDALKAPLALAAGAVGTPALLAGLTGNVHAKPGELTVKPTFYPLARFKPEIDLSGKLAVVTGASRGNGRAVAEALAAQEVQVIGTSRDPANVPNPPTSYPLLALDIADPLSVGAFLAELQSHEMFLKRGHVDILVNNAGRMVVGQIVPLSPADFEFYLGQRELGMRTLYSGHVMLTNAMLPLLPQQGYARIVFTVSIVAYLTQGTLEGASLLDTYCSGKAALLRYANNLDSALRAGGSNIRVCTVNPFLMNTALPEHPNPIYTQPVNADGLSNTDAIFNFVMTFLRQSAPTGLPTSMVGETYVQLLSTANPPQNVAVGSARKPFDVQGQNALLAGAAIAENEVSALRLNCG